MNTNTIKSISIRGRYAIGLTCAKLLIRKQGLIHDLFYRKLINKFGEFTNAKWLDNWEKEMMIYLSYDYLHADEFISEIKQLNDLFKENYKARMRREDTYNHTFEIFEKQFYTDLVNFYQNPDNKEIITVIELCYELARTEMYTQMSRNNSFDTHERLIDILELTGLEDEFNYQKIAQTHLFSEENGWGKTFDYKTFQRK